MKQLRFLAIGAVALTLTACQTMEGMKKDWDGLNLSSLTGSSEPKSEDFVASAGCPKAQVVGELGTYSEFLDSSSPASGNMISEVEITNLDSRCTFTDKSMTVDLKMAFNGRLGPKGRVKSSDMPFYSYPFFVAVTSPGGDILAKEVFAASITYDTGKDSQTYFEDLRQVIPISSKSRGARYKVLVGFQLTDAQLAHNRAVAQAEKEAAAAAVKPAAGAKMGAVKPTPAATITNPQPETVDIKGPPKQKPVPIDITAP